MSRSIVILLGHPDRDSLCGALAARYQHAALAAGHQVQLFALGEIDFDPILRHGYRQIQPLEPGLEQINAAIAACQHLVLVYPTWWGGMPALLKGFFDRAFLPGVAFRYRADSVWWDRLLAGRSARVITAPPSLTMRWRSRSPLGSTVIERGWSSLSAKRLTTSPCAGASAASARTAENCCLPIPRPLSWQTSSVQQKPTPDRLAARYQLEAPAALQ